MRITFRLASRQTDDLSGFKRPARPRAQGSRRFHWPVPFAHTLTRAYTYANTGETTGSRGPTGNSQVRPLLVGGTRRQKRRLFGCVVGLFRLFVAGYSRRATRYPGVVPGSRGEVSAENAIEDASESRQL